MPQVCLQNGTKEGDGNHDGAGKVGISTHSHLVWSQTPEHWSVPSSVVLRHLQHFHFLDDRAFITPEKPSLSWLRCMWWAARTVMLVAGWCSCWWGWWDRVRPCWCEFRQWLMMLGILSYSDLGLLMQWELSTGSLKVWLGMARRGCKAEKCEGY